MDRQDSATSRGLRDDLTRLFDGDDEAIDTSKIARRLQGAALEDLLSRREQLAKEIQELSARTRFAPQNSSHIDSIRDDALKDEAGRLQAEFERSQSLLRERRESLEQRLQQLQRGDANNDLLARTQTLLEMTNAHIGEGDQTFGQGVFEHDSGGLVGFQTRRRSTILPASFEEHQLFKASTQDGDDEAVVSALNQGQHRLGSISARRHSPLERDISLLDAGDPAATAWQHHPELSMIAQRLERLETQIVSRLIDASLQARTVRAGSGMERQTSVLAEAQGAVSSQPVQAYRPMTAVQQAPDVLFQQAYDPHQGFSVLFDGIVGLSHGIKSVRLVYTLLDGSKTRASPHSLPACTVTSVSGVYQTQVVFPQGTVFAIKSCRPRSTLHLLVEVFDADQQLGMLGWTKLYLFTNDGSLAAGRWRLCLRRPPTRREATSIELQQVPRAGAAEVCVRLVDGRLTQMHSTSAIDTLRPEQYLRNGLLGADLASSNSSPSKKQAKASRSADDGRKGRRNAGRRGRQRQKKPTENAGASFGDGAGETRQVEDSEDGPEARAISQDKRRVHSSSEKRQPTTSSLHIRIIGVNSPTEMLQLESEARCIFRVTVWSTESQQPLGLSPWSSATFTASSLKVKGFFPIEATLTTVPIANSLCVLELSASHSPAPLGWACFVPPAPGKSQVIKAPFLRGTVAPFDAPQSSAENMRVVLSVSSTPGRAEAAASSAMNRDKRDSKVKGMLAATEARTLAELPEGSWVPFQGKSLALSADPRAGFDLYIDGARFLPYNTTISKVVGRMFNRDQHKQGHDITTTIDLDSHVYSPRYSCRMEYRDACWTPTSTVLLKIYSIDRITRELTVVGYASLNVFVSADTGRQPTTDTVMTPILLNAGNHQLRLHCNGPDASRSLAADCLVSPHVPCASLLVRLLPAPCSSSGQPLSRLNVPPDKWKSSGLDVPAPSYTSGLYMSNACKPSDSETQLFQELCKREVVTVRQAIPLAGDGREKRLNSDKARQHWIRSRLTRPSGSAPPDVDLTYVSKFCPSSGVKVAVDRAYNLPKAKLCHAVVSLAPPATLYMSDKVSREDENEVHITSGFRHDDPDCRLKCPIWAHEPMLLKPTSVSPSTAIIIDLLYVDVKSKRLLPAGFALCKVFHGDHVVAGKLRLPVFQGPVDDDLLLEITTKPDKPLEAILDSAPIRKRLKILEGAHVDIRLCDARLDMNVLRCQKHHTFPGDAAAAEPEVRSRSKHILTLAPRGVPWEVFMDEVSETMYGAVFKES